MNEISRLAGIATVFAATGSPDAIRADAARVARLRRRAGQLAVRRRETDHQGQRAQLEVAWTYPAGQTDFNPLVVRGVVYGRGAERLVRRARRRHRQAVWIHKGVQGFNSRGMNYWESKDGKDRRLIFSANNLLQAIDAQTGRADPIVRRRRHGRPARGARPRSRDVNQQSRTPGRVFENLIILGSATNQEYTSAPGDIRAFDVRTGELVWTFHTVPRPGEFGYDTWPPEAWKTIGGANNWGEQSIDEKRGIVYVPTGSPKYNFYGGNRKGANLFGDCLLALDARTGKRLWHFQTVHHDIWDLDNNSAPQLTTIRRNGRAIDVVAVASKTGYLYVFDRVTGKPIWPIEERPGAAAHRRARRSAVADAAVPDQPAAVLAPEVHRRRSESAHPDARGARAVPAADPESEERGAVHADRVRRSDPHAGQPGRLELGQHRRESRRTAASMSSASTCRRSSAC